MKIVWDDAKRTANRAKHGLDFASVTLAIFDAGVVLKARDGRFKALGYLEAIAVVMIFAPLGREGIAVISLRRANAKERRLL